MILSQLVDAAIDMHAKGVFHRDIKLENTLIQRSPTGAPRIRLIDFGCGSFSTETSYDSFCGMISISQFLRIITFMFKESLAPFSFSRTFCLCLPPFLCCCLF